MKITLARLQTALAIAGSNGDKDASAAFQSVIDGITPFAKDPYIMPDNLTPPAATPDISAMSTQEVHDAVQAGAIDHVDAVAAGVNVPPPEQPVTVPADVPVEPAVPTGDSVQPTAVPDPVTPPSDLPPAIVGDADTQGPPGPVVNDTGSPSQSAVVSQADSGDEDPTPADKETIASLDARLDKIERPGKVSRQ